MVRIFLVVGLAAALVLGLTAFYLSVQRENIKAAISDSNQQTATVQRDDRLVVVWTSGDPEVALDMVLMYTYNAKKQGWWKDVTLVVWGPSQRLVVENEEIKAYIKKIKAAGITVEACKACADELKVTDGLTACSVDVNYMGTPLTRYIKNAHVVTF